MACAGLTSWKHIAIILHIGGKSLIITSFEVFIKKEVDLGGDLCGWAALFRVSTAHPVNWEDAKKGASNIVCLTKLVRLLRLTAVHWSRNKPNRIQSKTYAKERYKINICCWNVRTLLDLPSSKRPERRTALVSRELGRLNIDIAALSDTRLAEDQLIEKKIRILHFLGRKNKKWEGKGGVGFAIKSDLVKNLERPAGITDCNSFKQGDINILDKFAWNVWFLTQQETAKVKSYIY